MKYTNTLTCSTREGVIMITNLLELTNKGQHLPLPTEEPLRCERNPAAQKFPDYPLSPVPDPVFLPQIRASNALALHKTVTKRAPSRPISCQAPCCLCSLPFFPGDRGISLSLLSQSLPLSLPKQYQFLCVQIHSFAHNCSGASTMS